MTRPGSEWLEETLGMFSEAGAQWHSINPDDLQARREVVATLIRQLTHGLRLLGVEEANLQPLQTLNLALFDLTEGVRNSLFQITSTGREPDRAARRRSKLFAVSLVQWLIEGGMRVRPALELVAKEYKRAGHRGHNNRDITWNTIKKWRDTSFEGGDRKPDAAVVEAHLRDWWDRLGDRPRTRELDLAHVKRVAAGSLESSQKA